jgi:serine/threonine-protein kinase
VSELATIAEIRPGTILLDRYRVLRDLGVGGMSLVVCAEHVALRTKVAIKLLLPDLTNLPDSPQRFEREAKAATRVEGEHVCKVLDVGILPAGAPGAGTPYMVMEYLEGKDLGRLVKEGRRFAVPEAIDLVVQAADALSRAHEAGVVHRDVKPSNLFLTTRSDGSWLVKVLDFGISKVVEDAAQDNLALTKTTAVMGSALYMSLEQMRSTKTVDRRTDIWALGVTLYELLSGTHPWTADSFSSLCVKVSLDPPAPLREHRPDVPEALAAAIEVAYSRKPEERYQSVGQLLDALSPFARPDTRKLIRAIRDREEESEPGLRGPVRPPGPRRLFWVLGAVLGGVVLAGAAAVAVGGHGGAAPADAGVDAGITVSTTPDAAPAVDAAAPPEDAGAILAAVDAGVPAVDAGVVRPPHDPCAGKPRGTMVRMPNGLMRPCM